MLAEATTITQKHIKLFIVFTSPSTSNSYNNLTFNWEGFIYINTESFNH